MADTQFNMNANTTTGLSAEMKTYYSDYLIDNAVPNLVHDQFGQKHTIPANGGKTINFRKFVPFSKATKPLSEGVTPDGGSISVTNVVSEVSQYGYYVTLSDMLMLTAVDNTLVEATKLLGNQAGSTLDTVTREVLNSGTNVMYCGDVEARCLLGEDAKLGVDDIYKAARYLKTQNAPKIDGGYVAIIHPDVAYDLMRNEEWIEVNKYSDTGNIFSGEIGKIAGVRFVESTEAKVFKSEPFMKQQSSIEIVSYDGNVTDADANVGVSSRYKVCVADPLVLGDLVNLVGNVVRIQKKTISGEYDGDFTVRICGADLAEVSFFIDPEDAVNFPDGIEPGWIITPANAGLNGMDVYSTLIMGANAYGVTEVTGGGLEHIVKQLGSGGSADPLNQRATAGWKGTKAAELLVDNYIVRVESTSTFSA